MASDDPVVFQPDPEDFSFTFNNIIKGYANVQLLLKNAAVIRQAIEHYRIIEQTPAAAKAFSPENTSAHLAKTLSRLSRAAKYWQADPGEAEFQRDYSQLVAAAAHDAAEALPVLEEARSVIGRHMAESRVKGSSMPSITGLQYEDLQQSYKRLDRIIGYLRDFSDSLGMVSKGNMVVGVEDDSPAMKRALARPIKKEKNPDFEKEVLFYGLVGMLSAEHDNIVEGIKKIEPSDLSNDLMMSFQEVTEKIRGYATFDIDDPNRAIEMMRPHVPRCLEALGNVKAQLDEKEFGIMSIMMDCLERLGGQGQGRGRASGAEGA